MLQYIFDGKSMMYPIVLLFVIGLAVIIDRALAFRAAARNNKELTDGVIDALSKNDVEGAADLCTKIGGPVAAVLLVGVQKFGKLVDTDRTVAEMSAIVKTSMEDFAPQIIGTLDRNQFRTVGLDDAQYRYPAHGRRSFPAVGDDRYCYRYDLLLRLHGNSDQPGSNCSFRRYF